MQDLTYTVVTALPFDATVVTSLTAQVLRDTSAGPWLDSSVHIDSVTFSGGVSGSYTFPADASILTRYPATGPAATWSPSLPLWGSRPHFYGVTILYLT